MSGTYTRGQRRDHIWRVLRELSASGMPINPTAIRGCLRGGIPLEPVQEYLRALAAGGYLTRTEGGYLLARDAGVEAPRLKADGSPYRMGQSRERLWNVMRICKTFDIRGLAATASTEEAPIRLNTVLDYCARLAAAGFLVRLGRGHYRLLPHRVKGPWPIQVRRDKSLYDPNTGKSYSAQGEERP